jgi:hypothetical protein
MTQRLMCVTRLYFDSVNNCEYCVYYNLRLYKVKPRSFSKDLRALMDEQDINVRGGAHLTHL